MDLNTRFGRLVVLHLAYKKNKNLFWKCQCDCGNVTTVSTSHLNRGTKSCGCWLREFTSQINKPKDNSKFRHPLYSVYSSMLARCYNRNATGYPDYGGRGIKICQEWLDDFWQFVTDVGDRPEGLTLDRKDTNGNYEKSNIRWASWSEQRLNQRRCYG